MMSGGGTEHVHGEGDHVFLQLNLETDDGEQLVSTGQGCRCWGWAGERGLSKFDGWYQLGLCPNHACHSSGRDS